MAKSVLFMLLAATASVTSLSGLTCSHAAWCLTSGRVF